MNLKEVSELQKLWKNSSLEEIYQGYSKQLGGRKIDESIRRRQLAWVWSKISPS